MHIVDASSLEHFKTEISYLGNTVNDPNLFDTIQEACLKKRAFLFVAEEGFCVLAPSVEDGVVVWVAYAFKPINRYFYLHLIENLAKEIDAKKITFWSDRKGFFRTAPKMGFTPEPCILNGVPHTCWTKQL